MDGGQHIGAVQREVRHESGTLQVYSAAPNLVMVDMDGAITVDHVICMTQYVDTVLPAAGGKLSIFQDLTRVTAYAMQAQLHVSTWALEQPSLIERLHFALTPNSPLLPTIRAVVMALPIRAYMYRDRAGLDAALGRALPKVG